MALSIADRLRLMKRYVGGEALPVPGPLEINLETTVRCNLRCPMCPRTGAGYPNADLPDELVYRTLDQAAELGTEQVLLFGLGEPFMDRRIFDILRYCRARGLGTMISSNGSFLDADRRARLLDVGCDQLIVSIDGASAATYSRYRIGGHFDRVVGYARALAEEKAARRSPMTLVVQMIRMRDNLHEEGEFVRYWRAVRGVDLVRVKDEDVGLPEHATRDGNGRQRVNPCHVLWRGPFCVRYNGDVFACSHMATGGAAPLGNIADASLGDLWNSPEMQRLRALHAGGQHMADRFCADCQCFRPRLPLIVGSMAIPSTTIRRIIPVAERVGRHVPLLVSERRAAKPPR